MQQRPMFSRFTGRGEPGHGALRVRGGLPAYLAIRGAKEFRRSRRSLAA